MVLEEVIGMRLTSSRAARRVVLGLVALLVVACSSSGSTTAPTASGQAASSEPTAAPPSQAAAACSGLAFYLSPGLFDEFQAGSKLFLEQYGTEQGLEVRTLNANNNATQQLAQLDDALAQNPAAVILAAVDTAQMAGGVKKIQDAGVLAIAYDRLIADAKADFTTTADTTKMGQLGAQEIVKLLTAKNGSPKGLVLEQMGDLGDSYTIGIDQGFSEVVKDYPDIQVIRKDAAGWEPTVAAQAVDDVLTANPGVDLVWVHSEGLAPAIVPVLERHGFAAGDGKLIFMGASGLPVGLQLIRDGWMTETIDYPLSPEYVASVDFICKHQAGESVDTGTWEISGYQNEVKDESWGRTLWIPGEVITKDNVDDPNLWGNVKIPGQ
jgi:ribose transport system substrate-binding protein